MILQDTSELEELAKARQRQLVAMRTELTGIQQENDLLRQTVRGIIHITALSLILPQARHPSEALLRDSPFFQVYLQRLAFHVDRADTLQHRYETTERTLDALRNSNGDFHEAVLAEARTESDGLRQMLAKRDADLARLRGQRDDMNAELLERRSREGDKVKYADQVEVLAQARQVSCRPLLVRLSLSGLQERITFLVSEVKRLKGTIAAEAGAKGYLAFLNGDGGIDGNYVDDLEARLTCVSQRCGVHAC